MWRRPNWLMDHCAFFDPRRYQKSWHSNSKAFKVKVKWIGPNYTIWTGHIGNRSWNMIKKPSMLIVSDKKHHFIPLRTCSESFIDLFHELLSLSHIMRWMVVICWKEINVKVPLLYHNIIWQDT
eukprot:Gb_13229 [translate_table: standard]